MDSLQDEQHQAMVAQSLEDVLACPKPQQERRLRPHPDQALKCPRCDSTNTKFCYYNNYSLSQPRYFCKGCRRYWTQGGSLRNVPVGGGCRKNKRNSSSKRSQDQSLTTNSNPLSSLSSLTHDSSDLTLAFARLHKHPTRFLGLDDHGISIMGNPSYPHCDVLGNPSTTITPGFLDCLRGDFVENPSGFHNFCYGFGNGTMGGGGGGGGGGEEEVVLPFEDHSGATTTTTTKEESYYKIKDEENKVFRGYQWQVGGDSNMVVDSARDYWNGVGSSSWQALVNSPLM